MATPFSRMVFVKRAPTIATIVLVLPEPGGLCSY